MRRVSQSQWHFNVQTNTFCIEISLSISTKIDKVVFLLQITCKMFTPSTLSGFHNITQKPKHAAIMSESVAIKIKTTTT